VSQKDPNFLLYIPQNHDVWRGKKTFYGRILAGIKATRKEDRGIDGEGKKKGDLFLRRGSFFFTLVRAGRGVWGWSAGGGCRLEASPVEKRRTFLPFLRGMVLRDPKAGFGEELGRGAKKGLKRGHKKALGKQGGRTNSTLIPRWRGGGHSAPGKGGVEKCFVSASIWQVGRKSRKREDSSGMESRAGCTRHDMQHGSEERRSMVERDTQTPKKARKKGKKGKKQKPASSHPLGKRSFHPAKRGGQKAGSERTLRQEVQT